MILSPLTKKELLSQVTCSISILQTVSKAEARFIDACHILESLLTHVVTLCDCCSCCCCCPAQQCLQHGNVKLHCKNGQGKIRNGLSGIAWAHGNWLAFTRDATIISIYTYDNSLLECLRETPRKHPGPKCTPAHYPETEVYPWFFLLGSGPHIHLVFLKRALPRTPEPPLCTQDIVCVTLAFAVVLEIPDIG